MEELIVCQNCGREVPKTLYCIYCGAELPRDFFKKKEEPTGVRAPTPPVSLDVAQLMSGIMKYYTWKIRLFGVLKDGGVSESVFKRLFEEYVSNLNRLMKERNERLENYLTELKEKQKRLEEIKMTLEELKVRCAVGEINEDEYRLKAPDLEGEAVKLEDDVNMLKRHIDYLNNVFAGKRPKEVLELEKMAKECYASIDDLVNKDVISWETAEEVKKDLEETLKFFETVIGDRKEREKALREELSTLEARYKVGEISIAEYERAKREIKAELEKIWS